MIAYLKGQLIKSAPDHVVIEVNGIGYRVFIPLSSYENLPPPGEEMSILTYLHVREDELSLYGFIAEEERQLFKMLLGVSKIGPKVALAILGGIPVSSFKHAIVSGDARLLSTIHGIGQKTAERLIVELKDKITLIPRLQEEAARVRLVEGDKKISDVLEALISLGCSHAKAHRAIKKALGNIEPESSTEELLKESLKYI